MKTRGTVEATDGVVAPSGTFANSLTISGVPVATGTGTVDHAALSNLDFASAGHTGFASTTDLANASGTLDENLVSVSGHLNSSKVSKTGDSMTGQLVMFGGNASVPSITWTTDLSTGMYRNTSGVIRFSCAGLESGRVSQGGFSTDYFFLGETTNDDVHPIFTFWDHGTTGFTNNDSFLGAPSPRIMVGGTVGLSITGDEVSFASNNLSQIIVLGLQGTSTAAAPAISRRGWFNLGGDPDTGIYFPAADELGFSAGGVKRVVISGSGSTDGVGIADNLTVVGTSTFGDLVNLPQFGSDPGSINDGDVWINSTTSGIRWQVDGQKFEIQGTAV